MKNIRVLFFVLLCIGISAGCGENTSTKDELQKISQSGQNETIKLEEKSIPFPEIGDEIFAWTELSENETPIILTQEIILNESNEEVRFKGYQWNNEVWETIELPWSESLYKKRIYNSWPQKGQDGKYYLVNIERDKRDDGSYENYTMYRFNDSSQFEEIKTKNEMFSDRKTIEEDSKEVMSGYTVLDDSTLLVSYVSGRMCRYDLNTSEKLCEFQSSSSMIGNIWGNGFYAMDAEMNKILVTDVKTGEITQEIDFKVKDNEDRQVRFCLDEEENLYIVTRDGIFCKYRDAEEPELLLSADNSAVYVLSEKEDVFIWGINKKEDNLFVSYLMRNASGHGQTLYQYRIKQKSD